MKKLVLFAAIVAAVSFASCSNKTQEEAAPVETTTEAPAQEEAAPVQEAPAQEAAPATEAPATPAQ